MKRKQRLLAGGAGLLLLVAVPLFLHNFSYDNNVFASTPAPVGSYFHYRFSVDGTLDEAGSMAATWSPYWWLNSGGQFFLEDGVGRTVQGEISVFSKWYLHYLLTNSRDTDSGYHPQNIFRLVTRSAWQDFDQRLRFRITDINMSDSPERDGWSGVLLFSRYLDGDNLYYAGVRMDGHAVIKKKKDGTYYTLAYEPVYEKGAEYNRETNPNLIPENQWIGLRSVIVNNDDGSVRIALYVDRNDNGSWELAVQAKDDGTEYGGAPIRQKGYAGIRTDFMDAEFDDYKAMAL